MKRIEVLDLWRSLAIFLMVVFHFWYDLFLFGYVPFESLLGPVAGTLADASAGSFIMVSGASAHFSKSNKKRGFRLFLIAAALTVVTTLANLPIKFGILHFLSVCMMLYGVIGARKIFLSKVTPLACVALFAIFRYITDEALVSLKFLYPLGFRHPEFESMDYYPMLPWIFLFIIGIWIGDFIKRHREEPIFCKKFPPALTFLGRHSLAVYALHQPILLALVYLLTRL